MMRLSIYRLLVYLIQLRFTRYRYDVCYCRTRLRKNIIKSSATDTAPIISNLGNAVAEGLAATAAPLTATPFISSPVAVREWFSDCDFGNSEVGVGIGCAGDGCRNSVAFNVLERRALFVVAKISFDQLPGAHPFCDRTRK